MSQNPTWTEPPWSGWIETTGDALLILEAARRGLIPRVTRRLVDSERRMITSGSVFVFDEDESGIKRWTDGFFWSPSRILGNFLLYRETDKKGASNRGRGPDPDANDHSQYNMDGVRLEGQTLSRPKSETGLAGVNKQRERTLMGSLTNSYKFKPDGLMKKTFSLTIAGVSQHLISYYRIEDVENGRLRPPSSLPELASLDISPEYLDKTHFRNPPKVEIGADGRPRYRGEADDIENSPSAPLSTGLPLLTDSARTSTSTTDSPSSSANRRDRRFNPLSITPSAPKRIRKPTKSSPTDTSPSTPLPPDTPTSSSATSATATAFPDPPPPTAPSTSTQGYPPAQSYFPPYPQPPHPHMYATSPYPPSAPHPPPQAQYNYPYDQARAAPPYYPSYSTHPPPPPPGFNAWHPHSQPHTHPHSHAHSQGHYQGYPQHLQHAQDTGKHDTGAGERKS